MHWGYGYHKYVILV